MPLEPLSPQDGISNLREPLKKVELCRTISRPSTWKKEEMRDQKDNAEEEVKPSFLDELLTVDEFLELTNHEYDITPATRKPYNYKTNRKIVEDMEKVDEGEVNDSEVDIVIQLLDDQVEVGHKNDIIKLNDKEYKRLDIQQKIVHQLDDRLVKNNPSVDPTPTMTKYYNSDPPKLKEDITVAETGADDVKIPAYISNPSDEQKLEEKATPIDRSDTIEISLDIEDIDWPTKNIPINKPRIPVYYKSVDEEVYEPEEEETSDEGLISFIGGWFG